MGYLSPGFQISIRGGGGWGTALLVYKYVLGVREDGGIALLVYQLVLGVEEDGIPLFWITNKY